MGLSKEARAIGELPNGSVKSERLYSRWNVMRRRCYDKNFIVYRYYGGRGIRVCEEWRKTYLPFQEWALSHGWREDLTLDRIDTDGDYSPDNCRWITIDEQQRNRGRFNIKVTVGGVTRLICDWADYIGVKRSSITSRVTRYGWSKLDAVLVPIKGKEKLWHTKFPGLVRQR